MAGKRTDVIRLRGMSPEQLEQISRRIADVFYDYKYNEEDTGLIGFLHSREAVFIYIDAIVQAAYRGGVLYAASDRHEGYLILSGEGAGGRIGFFDGMRMILAEKRALGGYKNMKSFISACFRDGGTIETRMRKKKRKFLRIEVLAVRKEYQRQGYMRRLMNYVYMLAEKEHVPVILDTDDKDKAARYEHLGMELSRVRSGGEKFHMYDLICEKGCAESFI